MSHQTTTIKKSRLREVRSGSDLRKWWNTVVDVKVKTIVATVMMATFVIMGFQYQVNHITEARLDDLCEIRIETREELTKVLYAIVDIEDLGLDPVFTDSYTTSRTDTIDRLYGDIKSGEDCA